MLRSREEWADGEGGAGGYRREGEGVSGACTLQLPGHKGCSRAVCIPARPACPLQPRTENPGQEDGGGTAGAKGM